MLVAKNWHANNDSWPKLAIFIFITNGQFGILILLILNMAKTVSFLKSFLYFHKVKCYNLIGWKYNKTNPPFNWNRVNMFCVPKGTILNFWKSLWLFRKYQLGRQFLPQTYMVMCFLNAKYTIYQILVVLGLRLHLTFSI